MKKTSDRMNPTNKPYRAMQQRNRTWTCAEEFTWLNAKRNEFTAPRNTHVQPEINNQKYFFIIKENFFNYAHLNALESCAIFNIHFFHVENIKTIIIVTHLFFIQCIAIENQKKKMYAFLVVCDGLITKMLLSYVQNIKFNSV